MPLGGMIPYSPFYEKGDIRSRLMQTRRLRDLMGDGAEAAPLFGTPRVNRLGTAPQGGPLQPFQLTRVGSNRAGRGQRGAPGRRGPFKLDPAVAKARRIARFRAKHARTATDLIGPGASRGHNLPRGAGASRGGLGSVRRFSNAPPVTTRAPSNRILVGNRGTQVRRVAPVMRFNPVRQVRMGVRKAEGARGATRPSRTRFVGGISLGNRPQLI